MPAEKSSLAWAAGLFEGEGSFTIINRPNSKGIKASLGITDYDVLVKFKEAVGVGQIYKPKPSKHKNRKQCWLWQCSKAKDVIALAKAFEPFMGLRRTARIKELQHWWTNVYPIQRAERYRRLGEQTRERRMKETPQQRSDFARKGAEAMMNKYGKERMTEMAILGAKGRWQNGSRS